ncbi:MAG: class C sortase [Actinomyces sp.]|uniref:class C sortase n=1 Tax=Actinomyces sp. TaxID=29317 RepID=UPI0026DC73EA|nr:class C sortase [Actinomyces sp.]MDO4244346.1 class C sortase [Actinomyces sp.]
MRTAGRRPRPRPARWRLRLSALLPALMALAGMALLSYPTVAAWFSQYNQSQIISGYAEAVSSAEPAAAQQIALAHAYNDALSSGAMLNAGAHVPVGDGQVADGSEALDYNEILTANEAGLMARLQIPSIDLDLPVYHGTAEDTLLAGLGHLEGTSLPVGGEGTRSVITGHRGLANATMFTDLDKVSLGDTFTLEVFGEVLSYRVVDVVVVAPEDTESLRAEEGRDLVTLVTCTPLGINSHRILLTGERIYPTPAEAVAAAQAAPEIPAFPWWAVWLSAGLLLVCLYLWRAGLPPARSRRPAATAAGTEATAETTAAQASAATDAPEASAGAGRETPPPDVAAPREPMSPYGPLRG